MTIKQEALDIEPTEEQMKKLYEAWEKGGRDGLGKALRQQNQELRERGKRKRSRADCNELPTPYSVGGGFRSVYSGSSRGSLTTTNRPLGNNPYSLPQLLQAAYQIPRSTQTRNSLLPQPSQPWSVASSLT